MLTEYNSQYALYRDITLRPPASKLFGLWLETGQDSRYQDASSRPTLIECTGGSFDAGMVGCTGEE